MKSVIDYENFLMQLYPNVDGNVQMLIERALKNIGGLERTHDGLWVKIKHKEIMDLVDGDYIEGTEYYGDKTKKIKGWVRSVNNFNGEISVDIQADDQWRGARGTAVYLHLGDIKILEPKPRP